MGTRNGMESLLSSITQRHGATCAPFSGLIEPVCAVNIRTKTGIEKGRLDRAIKGKQGRGMNLLIVRL